MERAKVSLSLTCPEHEMPIGMLNTDPNAKKLGYCYECLDESDGTVNLKSVTSYLKDIASSFEACRQRAHGREPPANYLEELNKKGERLVQLSQYIDQEKDKVKKSFEDLRKKAIEIIDEKEKKLFERLDKEVPYLSDAYAQYEKLLYTGWLKPSDINAMYPELDVLKQRLSKIENIDQLQAFMVEVQEDIQRATTDNVEKESLERKNELDLLVRRLHVPQSSLPKAHNKFLNPESMEVIMKDFIEEEIVVSNSVLYRALSDDSKIIVSKQFEALRDWLPKGHNLSLKLLYRGSVDGFSSQKFHEKCDGQGATVTLIKCKFGGVEYSSIIGGFIDQSWHSNSCYSSSNEAFLFSLGDQRKPFKCPIYRTGAAFTSTPEWGLKFGEDLQIEKTFQTGRVGHWAYSHANTLAPGNVATFRVEEVEVYQVPEIK